MLCFRFAEEKGSYGLTSRLRKATSQTLRTHRPSRHVENCARTSAETRTGRPVCVSIGHHNVRAVDKSWRSRLRRISVKRSNVTRVALPTHVRRTISSLSVAACDCSPVRNSNILDPAQVHRVVHVILLVYIAGQNRNGHFECGGGHEEEESRSRRPNQTCVHLPVMGFEAH